MTLRRYAPMKPSRGTVWPSLVRRVITARDGGYCVGPRAGLPDLGCMGTPIEIDHVRASGGISMKSRSTVDNGALLCPVCHRWKTDHGRDARPLLIDWINLNGPLADALEQEIAS